MRQPLAAAGLPLPSSVKIASWNVNSIKVRAPQVIDWLKASDTDILMLQEIKTTQENFPSTDFTEAGYEVHVNGQKTYNGVALASRIALDDVRYALPLLPDSTPDEQARYIEADYAGFTIANLYLPNGNPTCDDDGGRHEKFAYKLDWMKRLHARADALNQENRPIIFGGDFNIIPDAMDCWDIEKWQGDALHHPESLGAYRALCWLGYTDLYRAHHPHAIAYSFWDYQRGAWQKDNGIRIDHFLANAEATDRIIDVGIDKSPRDNERASDHTPIWCRLKTD